MKNSVLFIIRLAVILKLIALYKERQQKACQTERDTAVFYAGATYDGQNRYNSSDAANEYAKDVGGTTIDLNFEAQELDWPEDRELGRELSKMYAENAGGDVRVFLGDNDAYSSLEMPDEEVDFNDGRHPLNTWETVECPALLANENVNSITVYDPETQEEAMVCDRKQGDGSTEDMVKQYNSYLETKGSEFRYGVSGNGDVRQCAPYALSSDSSNIKPEFDIQYKQYREEAEMGIRDNLKEWRRERGEIVTDSPALQKSEPHQEGEATPVDQLNKIRQEKNSEIENGNE